MNQELYEQIDRYLAGSMAAEERRAFEAALQSDAALAEAVSLQSALRQSLGDPARRQLLDALDDVVRHEPVATQTPGPRLLTRTWLAAAASLLLLIAAGLWWFSRQPELPAPVADAPAPTVPAPSALPPAGPAPSATPPADTPAGGRRLAMADPAAFRPNPALDPMAGARLRGPDNAPDIQQPQNDANFNLRDGAFTFALKGGANGQTALTLQIFNNREADFIAGKTVYQTELPVQGDAFSLKQALQLPPGRYYAVLTPAGEEEPVAVVRFFVGKPATPVK